MSSKNNFDEFKLENIFDPDFEKDDTTPEEKEVVVDERTEFGKGDTAVIIDNVAEETEEEDVEEPEEEVTTTDTAVAETVENVDEDAIDFNPFVEALHEKFGWDFDENTLSENSLEGVVGHIGEIVKSNVESIINDELSIGDGTLMKMYEFIKNGGDPKRFVETYYNPLDYSTIKLEDNDDLQERVISDFLYKQGFDADEIKDKVESYKKTNLLEREAIAATKKLAALQVKEKESLIENQKNIVKQREKEAEAYWSEVKNKINSWEKIGDFPILEKDKSKFYDYLNKKDSDGYTEYQKDVSKDSDAAIKMAYIQFKKFNMSSIKKSVETDVTKKVKASINKFNSSNKSGKSKEVRDESANNYSAFKLPW